MTVAATIPNQCENQQPTKIRPQPELRETLYCVGFSTVLGWLRQRRRRGSRRPAPSVSSAAEAGSGTVPDVPVPPPRVAATEPLVTLSIHERFDAMRVAYEPAAMSLPPSRTSDQRPSPPVYSPPWSKTAAMTPEPSAPVVLNGPSTPRLIP